MLWMPSHPPQAKEELVQVVDFLRDPTEFTRLGGRLQKGVLLMGPPGTGKTLLARAVAGEAGVPFFYCSGSEFDEMFVGVGAKRIRELFAAAKKKSPCIIFMDEIDAVGGKRSAKDQQYSKMTLNQLLVELDGFHKEDNIVIIAATNFPEALDPALIRPGRFDTHVNVGLPDVRGRAAILGVHAKNVPIAPHEEDDEKGSALLWKIARGTPGFSGADLANVVNQAALKASKDKKDAVDIKALEWAKEKIMMGAERPNAVVKEEVRRNTAYHEAGHALCAILAPGAMPLYKATIVPRGQSLGMVQQLPEDDVMQVTKKEMRARMVVAMGGYAAEELMYGKDNVSSGPSNDLKQATDMARSMVMKYAFSDKVGPISLDKAQGKQGEVVDSEIRRLCEEALDEARNIIRTNHKEHKRIAEALLEYETLSAEEIRKVMKGEKLSMIGTP
jgi:ATP-dependent metalloprotease